MSVQTLCDNTPVRPQFTEAGKQLPTDAQVVIVGGGIAGASVAYQFAQQGWKDIVLLEQNKIASGTTWHSAGQVGQLRSSNAQTQVNKASAQIYAGLLKETGHDPGWLNCGGLQLASCPERMYQLQRSTAMAQVFGVEANLLSPQECQEFWPMLNTDDLVGGVHLPGDGRVIPGECTVALATGALQNGVTIVEGVQVQQLLYQDLNNGMRRFTGVQTGQGTIQCQWIVLAGNMWMRQIGLSVDVDIPVYPCEHFYVITRPIPGVTRNCPCTRDPDAGLYFRALDDGGLKLGAFNRHSKFWEIGDKVPDDFEFRLLEPDWPEFEKPFADHAQRLKGIRRDDVVKFVNGPEAFTPDNNFIMGEPFSTEGLFVLGGWNSAGIACAGGAGKFAVEWIENGGMTLDLTAVDIRRFIPQQNGRKFLQSRVSEVLGLHYRMAWPGRQMETSRQLRASELWETHKQNNACFGESLGWERPLFFAPDHETPEIRYSFLKQNWREWVSNEVRACRENVVLIDQSTFSKYKLVGPEAVDVLQTLCGADVDQQPGRAIYTPMLNERGGYESDLTVTRESKDVFYLVSGTKQQRADFDWITRNLGDRRASLEDVTEQLHVLSVMGPNANRLLNSLFAGQFEGGMEAYGTVKKLVFGRGELLALRISYVGELGWELHLNREDAWPLYQIILEAGREFDLQPIGNFAESVLRIEKGFRAFGNELSPTDTPWEAGLAWTIDWEKEFLGKAALLERKRQGLQKQLVCFALHNPDVILWGNEPIYRDGKIAGYTTSACYSATLGRSIAMGYVSTNAASTKTNAGQFEIDCMGNRHLAKTSLRSPIQAWADASMSSSH